LNATVICEGSVFCAVTGAGVADCWVHPESMAIRASAATRIRDKVDLEKSFRGYIHKGTMPA
jgi:hypothetical protein